MPNAPSALAGRWGAAATRHASILVLASIDAYAPARLHAAYTPKGSRRALAGLKRYADLLPFLNDAERDVVLHAIAAFGNDTTELVVIQLIAELTSGNERRAPAASEALRIIGSDVVLKNLI